MIRALALFGALLLAGCNPPKQPTPTPTTASAATQAAVVADAPLPEAVEAVAPVQDVMTAAVEALEPVTFEAPLPLPPPAKSNVAQCRAAAAALIIRWEITGQGYYNRFLIRPIWPKGASGITWAVGYDGGHQTSRTILDDWQAHPEKGRLALTAGLTGKLAGNALPQYRDIQTPYLYAAEVFETRSLIEYQRIAERTYRIRMEDVPIGVCAALISVTYNRGGATSGDSRREVRDIRDIHLPAKNWNAVAAAIRAMKRLWRGTVNEKGLSARREDEAVTIETLKAIE